jgi:hypothetical protein
VTTRESTLALSIGYIDWIAEADSERWSLLPGLIVAGVAAGVLSTIKEMGGVIAGCPGRVSGRLVPGSGLCAPPRKQPTPEDLDGG